MAIGDGRGLVGLGGRELAKSLEAAGLGDLVAGHVGALGGDGAMASGAETLSADVAVVDEGGDEETAEGMAGVLNEEELTTSSKRGFGMFCNWEL